MKRNIRIVVAYDGTNFSGWQVQKDQRTVQGVIEAGLERMHGHPVKVIGAGRTDSGVHAVGQVANFITDIDSIPAHRYRDALNSYLPHDVRALKSDEVDILFDSRRWAKARVYRYYILMGDVGLPHLRNYCIKIRHRPDIVKLNDMAGILVGERDFTSFSATRDENEKKLRRVYSASFYPEGNFIVFQIVANAFLWKMVRSIVGTILELEKNGMGLKEFSEILEKRDRKLAGVTAPARGLFLERVIYDEKELY